MKTLIHLFKKLIEEIRLELIARQHFGGQARTSFKIWSKRVKRADELSPQERAEWDEERQTQWQDYSDQLM